MWNKSKLALMGLVASVVFSFSGSPAFAHNTDETAFNVLLASPNTISYPKTPLVTRPYDDESLNGLMSATTSDVAKSAHHFDVKATLDLARSEIGTHRPTGDGQPGECIMSASRWLLAGGAAWHVGGGPIRTYTGAKRLSIDEALPGDVVQYESLSAPDSYENGVHTMVIETKNPDGTFDIIQSNVPSGSGLVSAEKHWKPKPPAGFQTVVWRF